jgi:hypothetical protein
MSLLATKFHKIMFCSFREVAFTNCFGLAIGNSDPIIFLGVMSLELRKFTIFTTQFVSTTSETTEQNFMELGSYYGHNM